MSPARSSTLRCLETAGSVISNGSASSVTEASPEARRARIARRVGSASAAKVLLIGSDAVAVTIGVFNQLVKYTPSSRLSSGLRQKGANRNVAVILGHDRYAGDSRGTRVNRPGHALRA